MRNPGPEKDRVNRLIGGQPTNKAIADKITTFTFDHCRQMPIAPNTMFATGGDIGSSRGSRYSGRTMNSSGRDAGGLQGVRVGMSVDTRGKANSSGQGFKRARETYLTQGKK